MPDARASVPDAGPAAPGADPAAPDAPDARAGRRTIGFIAPNVQGYFFGNLLTGATVTAAARGSHVIAIQTHDAGIAVFEEEPFVSPLAWEHLDALIVAPAAVPTSYLRAFAETGKPIVMLYEVPEGLACPTVVPDNHQGVRETIEHLLWHGHTAIAFVGREPANADDEIRYLAYRTVMAEHGLEPWTPVSVPWELGETYDSVAAVRRLLERRPPPTAVMACTDVTALAVVKALGEAGVAVPDDVAVIGFDDIIEAAVYHPPLSTVSQSFTVAGATACTLALDALDGRPAAPGLHCIPVTLVIRTSCGCEGYHPDGAAGACGAEDRAGTTPAGMADLSARFVTDLSTILYGGREPTPAQRRAVLGVVNRLVGLYTTAARTPAADVTGGCEASAETLRQLVAGSPELLGALPPVRELGLAVAARLGPDDVVLAARLERLAFDVCARLLQSHRCGYSQAVVNQHVEIQRRYQMVNTELVRRYHRDCRSMTWLEGTEARAGCLALWEDGRGSPRDSRLRIVGTYHDGGAGAGQEEFCEVRAFPPRWFVELGRHHPGDLGFVLPVRFDGSDWGFLALSGAFDALQEAAFERFNHWAVLLTLALDQEQAVRSERALRGVQVSEERYALAADAANDGLWDWNLATGAVYYSTRWKALLGYADDEIGATCDEWLKRVHPADRAAVDRALAAHQAGSAPTMELEHRVRTADGTYRWMLTHSRSVRDADGRVSRLVGASTDITDRKLLEERLRHEAHYDSLTGLPNRTLFMDRLNQAIMRTRRHPEYRFAVVLLDLDGFKVVNDGLGHQIGDEVLIQVAKRLSTELRVNDTVSRFGGDEFVLLLDDVRDVAELPLAVKRLLRALSAPLTLAGRTRTVSAAAGVAVSIAGRWSADEYVRDADTAMYRAKSRGPGSVVMFDEDMHAGAMARLQLESDLDLAIAAGQFELFYQPIVRLDGRCSVGLEALIRWRHPERGLVMPDEFLPVAEATGQAREIGTWTIREACRQLRRWLDSHPDRDDFTVSVNLSNCQFWDPQLRPTVRRALSEFGITPSRLVIEVTEGVIMHNQDVASDLMRQLSDDGLKLHVDDFGTGHSSLSALHTFPIDALKIDRSFVNRMPTDARSRDLVGLMVTIGARFGVPVIAEGIETEAEAAALAELGCPLVQGYLFSRPVPASRVMPLLDPDGCERLEPR